MADKRGVLLVALGHHTYGQLAFNLAMSIKLNDPSIKIAVMHNDTVFSNYKSWHWQFFDYIIEVPKADYIIKGYDKPQYQRIKLKVCDYTPFEHNIYIDVDSVWFKGRSISWLFGELYDCEYTASSGGYYDFCINKHINCKYTFWGELDKIKEYWNIKEGRLYQTQSTFFYFKKTEKVKQMFKYMQEIYDDIEAPVVEWNGGKPDEYCFNIAMNKYKLYPHVELYKPIYLQMLDSSLIKEKLYANYWGMSTCGNRVHPELQKLYNRTLNEYAAIAEIPDRYYHIDKKDVIETRKRM